MCKRKSFFGAVVVMVMVVVVGPKGGGMMMGGVKNVFTDSLRPSRSRSWVRDDAHVSLLPDAYVRK
jgi:hypothetical protein